MPDLLLCAVARHAQSSLPVTIRSNSPPPRRIDNHRHQPSRHQPRHGHRHEPTKVNPRHHTPIDGAPVAVAQANTHGAARNALRRRDGQPKPRRHDDGDRGSELHREPARRRDERDAVFQIGHDFVAVSPEADDDGAAEKA